MSGELATRASGETRPRSEYVLRLKPQDYSGSAARARDTEEPGDRGASVRVKGPHADLPHFLASNKVVLGAWGVAMGVIAVDEWKRHGILPRPARLWWTTLLFGLLAVAGNFGPVLPLVNALAIGYAIVLIWQFYNKNGQFA